MKKPRISHKTAVAERNRIAFQGGTYSLVITAVVLAILVVVNVLAAALPTTYTKFDISSTQLYSVTSNTKAVLHALDQDVTIYWIVQADQEDDILSNLLSKYESLSDHISVVKRNPDVYPAFAEQYTEETVTNTLGRVYTDYAYPVAPVLDPDDHIAILQRAVTKYLIPLLNDTGYYEISALSILFSHYYIEYLLLLMYAFIV